MTVFVRLIVMIAIPVLAGCAAAPRSVSQSDIDLLAAQIESLGPEVDAGEAQRAATIAYKYSLQLAEEYNVTSNPILHNTKVNNGLRERGLCVHWAEDIEKRLNAENFRTLEIHRAIAEGNAFRIDHSTSVISKRGDSMEEGVVLDPWRFGGVLYWAPTLEDDKYYWEPRQQVLERKYRRKLELQTAAPS